MFGTEVVSDPIEEILGLLADLGAEDRAGWSGAAQSERVSGLARIVERAQAELVRATATWDGAGAWAEDGATSPISWLTARTPLAQGRAARLVHAGRLARRHERTAKALASGDITSGHVEVLAAKTARHKRLFAEHEDTLLDAATSLGVDEFESAAEKWRLLADELRANAETADVVEHGELLVTSALGRSTLVAELDAEGAKTVLDALDARCAAEPADVAEPRTLSQRRAAAMVEMAAASLAAGSPDGHRMATADVVIDVQTLRGLPPDDLTKIHCELSTGAPVPRETALRLCCDASIGRVVMNGLSEILDLGRRTRVVSAAQRRALAHRDRGCVFPGCHRKVEWTDAHHLRHWVDGGGTDLGNLCLLCRRHHVMIHEGGWCLTRDSATGVWTADRSPPRCRSD